jgi:hypothetical protein
MANYAVIKWASKPGALTTVMGELETYIETVDSSKTIRGIGIVPIGSDNAQAWVVHDA